jgi:hypothetical protein
VPIPRFERDDDRLLGLVRRDLEDAEAELRNCTPVVQLDRRNGTGERSHGAELNGISSR